MSLKAKLLLDSSDYNKKMDQAKAKATATGQEIKDKMSKAGEGFEAINKLGGATGGVMKNIQQAIAGMMSPIGLVMAGIAALGALAVKTWDKMNESLQEYKERVKTLLGILQKQEKERDELNKKQNENISILQQLASKQKLSNSEKILALGIIQQLTKRYGDLGISIDQVTGAIQGFDEAQKKIKVKQLNQKISATNEQISKLRQIAESEASAMMKEIGHETYSGGQTYRYDTNRYKSLQDASDKKLDVKFNPTHDLTYVKGSGRAPGAWHRVQLSEEDKRLRKLWNEGGLEGKREFAKSMLNRANGDGDRVQIYKNLYEALDLLIKKQLQYKNLKDYGTTDANDILAEYKKLAETENKIIDQHNNKMRETYARMQKTNRDSKYKSLDTDAQRVVFLEKELNELKKEGVELEQKVKKSKAEYVDIQNKVADLIEQQHKAVKNNNEQQAIKINQKLLEIAKKRNEILARRTADIQAEQANLEEQLRLELAIKELKQKSSDYYKSSLEALNAEIQITKLKLKGLNEQAQKQQLINELKLKGLMVDKAEVDKILEKRRQLAKLNKQLEDQNRQSEDQNIVQQKKDPYSVSGKSLYDKIQQKLNPFGYEYRKRLEEQQKKKGEALTKKQRNQIRKVVELEFKADNLLNSKIDLSGLQTLSNELASRGGFTSSVVEARKYDVNERIYQTQKSAENQLKMILTEMKKLGVIS